MNKTKKIAFLGTLLCAVFFILAPQQMSAQVSPEAARLLRSANVQVFDKPTSPPTFILPLLSGWNASLSSYKGKVVLLNFWATWCPPCRSEMPSMETLYQRYRNQGLEILAVDLSEDTETVRKFINDNRYSFTVMLDTNGSVGDTYGIRGIPTTYVLDRQGMIIGIVNGATHWDTPQMITAFEALLNSR